MSPLYPPRVRTKVAQDVGTVKGFLLRALWRARILLNGSEVNKFIRVGAFMFYL